MMTSKELYMTEITLTNLSKGTELASPFRLNKERKKKKKHIYDKTLNHIKALQENSDLISRTLMP